MEIHQVHIGKFDLSWDALNLKDYIEVQQLGEPLRIRVLYDSEKLQGKGMAFVTFIKNNKLAQEVLNYHQIPYKGRILKFSRPSNLNLDKEEDFDFESIQDQFPVSVNNFDFGTYEPNFGLNKIIEYATLYPLTTQDIITTNIIVDNVRRRFVIKLHYATILNHDYNVKIEVLFKDIPKQCGVTISDSNIILLTRVPPRFYSYQSIVTYIQRDKKEFYWTKGNEEKTWARCGNLLAEKNDLIYQMLFKHSFLQLTVDQSDINWHLQIARIQDFGLLHRETVMQQMDLPPNFLRMREIEQSRMSFEAIYALLALISHMLIPISQLNNELIFFLQTLDQSQIVLAMERIYRRFRTSTGYVINNFRFILQEYIQDAIDYPYHESMHPNSVKMRKILVTPSTIYIQSPEPEMSCRITRHFSHQIDNFLRISFIEENRGFFGQPSPDIINRVKGFLQSFSLFKKEYKIFGFSSSQLRAHQALMFCDNSNTSIGEMRRFIGNLSEIRNPGKYSARLGQALSDSYMITTLLPENIQDIPEIQTGKYAFSDGVGITSRKIAKRVVDHMNLDIPLTAFQVRIAGIKGVLAVYDQVQGDVIQVRPSMKKFESSLTELEVVNLAKLLPAYLNRQIILLLSTLRVQDQIFIQLAQETLQQYANMQLDNKMFKWGLKLHLADFPQNKLLNVALRLVKKGLSVVEEPFLQKLAEQMYQRVTYEFKSFAKIYIKDAAILMGVLDEIGVLDYGQVFLQIQPKFKNYAQVITGRIVLARNPCLHPGDIRIVTAVDVPELRHQINTVVFPQRGPRPHSSESSGGDLDGDLYMCIWDQRLIPAHQVQPMDYEGAPDLNVGRSINSQDVIDFFMEYLQNDTLGQIANAHMALADQLEGLALNEKCIKLAELHSDAVDAPKTGAVVHLPQLLRPKTWPDFMQKKDRSNTYESKRILGQLYRMEFMEPIQNNQNQPQMRQQFIGVEEIEWAKLILNRYSQELQEYMNLFKIQSDIALLAAETPKISKFYKKHSNRDEIKYRLQEVAFHMERTFSSMVEPLTQARAKAIYTVAHEGGYYSLPWLIADSELLNIFSEQLNQYQIYDKNWEGEKVSLVTLLQAIGFALTRHASVVKSKSSLLLSHCDDKVGEITIICCQLVVRYSTSIPLLSAINMLTISASGGQLFQYFLIILLKRFLTQFSVLPFKFLAISLQRLPHYRYMFNICKSSSTVQFPFLRVGFK